VANTIPKYFASLQKLQNLSDLSLNFSRRGLDQEKNTTTESISAGLILLKALPIQNLSLHLSTLYHSSDNLSLSRILPQFNLLKSLGLYFVDNQDQMHLRDRDLVGVLTCLREVPKLSSLTLSLSNLTQLLVTIGNVGEALKLLPGLAELKLKFGRLNCTDEDMERLCSGLECLSSLKSLELGVDWIKEATMKGIDALIKALKKMVRIRNLSLNLSGNRFITDQGFSNLCYSIKNLGNLAHLDINLSYGFHLNYKSAEELAETLKSLDHLETVGLNFIGFSGFYNGQGIFQTLFEVLKKKKTIQDVNLTLGLNFFGLYPPELLKFKQRKNLSLY